MGCTTRKDTCWNSTLFKSILLEGGDVGIVLFNILTSKMKSIVRGLMLLEDAGIRK